VLTGPLSTSYSEQLVKDRLHGAKSRSIDRTRSVTALKTLQGYLERHDSAASSYKYRLGVVERILLKNSDFELPPWLSMHYLVRDTFVGECVVDE
jgi:hypothetical protein